MLKIITPWKKLVLKFRLLIEKKNKHKNAACTIPKKMKMLNRSILYAIYLREHAN